MAIFSGRINRSWKFFHHKIIWWWFWNYTAGSLLKSKICSRLLTFECSFFMKKCKFCFNCEGGFWIGFGVGLVGKLAVKVVISYVRTVPLAKAVQELWSKVYSVKRVFPEGPLASKTVSDVLEILSIETQNPHLPMRSDIETREIFVMRPRWKITPNFFVWKEKVLQAVNLHFYSDWRCQMFLKATSKPASDSLVYDSTCPASSLVIWKDRNIVR